MILDEYSQLELDTWSFLPTMILLMFLVFVCDNDLAINNHIYFPYVLKVIGLVFVCDNDVT